MCRSGNRALGHHPGAALTPPRAGEPACVRLFDVSDPQLILVADVHGLVGPAAELRSLLSELADGARGEPDCIGFRVLSDDDPGEFVLLSSWTSEQALRTHYNTPHYRRYREQVGPLLARPSDVVVHRLAATVHALDPNPPDPEKLG
jgi:quinol monooxygenase YgiN